MLLDGMRSISNLLAVTFALLISGLSASANEVIIDDFQSQPETRWRFFADTVMGGVSTGNVRFLSEGEITFARLAGRVSTDNNGGFIQMRVELPSAAPAESPDRWTEIRLPFTAFKASGPLLRKSPKAQSLKSLGIVAFGRDHEAQIDVREVAFY